MTSIIANDQGITITFDPKVGKKAKELAEFLEEQITVWENSSTLQKELDKIDKEESLVFKFDE